jgi:hypothetical protein
MLQLTGRSRRRLRPGTTALDSVRDSKPGGQKVANFYLSAAQSGIGLVCGRKDLANRQAGCLVTDNFRSRQNLGRRQAPDIGEVRPVPAFRLLRVGAESICKSNLLLCAIGETLYFWTKHDSISMRGVVRTTASNSTVTGRMAAWVFIVSPLGPGRSRTMSPRATLFEPN